MARIVKEEEYTVRRNEILDAARRLVYTRGYEQMTIQDILDALKISKGAFYHYFDSKSALLEALIERMMTEAVQMLLPIVQDPNLPALQKFQRFSDAGMAWKAAQRDFFLPLLRIWYTDDNAIARQKTVEGGIKQLQPLLAEIIQQGVREGVFSTPLPEQVGEVLMALLVAMGDSLARQILSSHERPIENCLPQLRATCDVYHDALERVLGAPAHSLSIVDIEQLKAWLPDFVANSPKTSQ